MVRSNLEAWRKLLEKRDGRTNLSLSILPQYQRTVCTGDEKEINDSLESFPSGHSTVSLVAHPLRALSRLELTLFRPRRPFIHSSQAAAAGFVFLSLYINAQMKVMSDYRPAYWKQIFFFAPLLGVILIGGALTIDKFRESRTRSLFFV